MAEQVLASTGASRWASATAASTAPGNAEVSSIVALGQDSTAAVGSSLQAPFGVSSCASLGAAIALAMRVLISSAANRWTFM